ncbi:hypothetical protein [Desulfopila sp. IMCC35008]|uniref:phenylalanine--tRNA ligase subunit beta-related protein n=1 Tax=Desulfopila sp. IMCC35008 TaxID=2653858 RepID=UPI0013D63DED|nr:hypothetical protein [Desulfopila sp. IMCC35008]
MLSLGISETTTYCFTDPRLIDNLHLSSDDIRRRFVCLLNPLTKKQGVIRTLLLPGLLKRVKKDIESQQSAVRLFEIGTVFHPVNERSKPQEIIHISGVLTDSRQSEDPVLYDPAYTIDISDTQKVVERLLDELRVSEEINGEIEFVHPAQEGVENFCNPDYALLVFAGGTFLGSIGKIDPEILRSFSIKNEVCYFDLNFDAICELKTGVSRFSLLPVRPSARRDISLVVDQNVTEGQLLATIQNSREELIRSAEILDVFQGNMIDKGIKSVSVSITYRSFTKALTEKIVENVHTKIVKLLTDKFGSSFRDA